MLVELRLVEQRLRAVQEVLDGATLGSARPPGATAHGHFRELERDAAQPPHHPKNVLITRDEG